MNIEKLSPILGARVTGIDLAQPVSEAAFAAIHAAWIEHKVLSFPDQHLTTAQYAEFAGRFGELYVFPLKSGEGFSAVHELRTDESSKSAFGETWHSDMSSEECPPMGTMLYNVVIPADGGGDTLFADMVKAYEILSEPMKAMLAGLTATHDSSIFQRKYGITDKLPSAVHPLVRTHPVSGRKSLFVNTRFTTRINELTEGESRALLDYLFRYTAETPYFQYRFRWSPNTILLWDNRNTAHTAIFDYWPQLRHGYRVMIRGDKPVQ